MARTPAIIGSASMLTAAIFAASLLPVGERPLGPVENIHGILYPEPVEGPPNSQLITEPLAHADIYLHEPVLAKQLELTITYRPVNLTSLAVGIREDSFWLSYGSRQKIFSEKIPNSKFQIQTSTLTIPLTGKLQETDRSLDLMFFAESEAGEEPAWELHSVKASVAHTWPTYAELKNYAGSIIKRERAL